MTRLLLAFSLAALAGLCYWLATRERYAEAPLEPFTEPWGDL